MNIISYTVDFGLSSYQGNVAVFPFSVVMQTNSKKIENYCKTTWPKLMTHQQYTPQDNLDKYKMYKYIKDSLTTADKNDIHKLAYDRQWMTPLEYSNRISECKLTAFGCKLWSDPVTPYLELKGTISIDIIKLFGYYIKKQWFTFETSSGILYESPILKMKKPVPFIVKYTGSRKPYDILLAEVIRQAKHQNSDINRMLVTATKLKHMHEYNKKLAWNTDYSAITVEITEKIRLLKDKALANPIKYGLLGLATYQITKDWKPVTKGLAAATTYLYMKRKK